jgi:hypothetical protein
MANSNEKIADLPKMEGPIAKIEETLFGLKQNLCTLHQKIEIIDSKPELQSSIKK